MRRLKTRLRAEEGMTLIELLIAMVVMSIGIAALVAGFSSGILAVNRARATSTAGTLADKQMELYRQAAFTSLPPAALSGDAADRRRTGARTGSERRSAGRAWSATRITTTRRTPPTCTGDARRAGRSSSSRSGARGLDEPAKLLFTESATFDSSTG